MEIIFALAQNSDGLFEKNHFGEAEKFVIYRFDGKQMVWIRDLQNPFKIITGKTGHDLKKKGEGIIKILIDQKVSVIVSSQFGDNIRLVNKFFIPVIISGEEPRQVLDILAKYIHWIQDEVRNHPERHKLITIKNGILKTTIEQV